MRSFVITFYIIFVTYFLAINFLYIALTLLAARGSTKEVRSRRFAAYEMLATSELTPPVSIIVPAYNEEVGIGNALHSALNLIYPQIEIIFVNDGSTDRTFSIVKKEFDLEIVDAFYKNSLPSKHIRGIYRSKRFPNMLAIDKENGGKADALNAGINLAKYPHIVDTDADSIFDTEGLLRIARVISTDRSVAGVGGQIRVGNGLIVEKGRIIEKRFPRPLVTNFQVVEYMASFLSNRAGWSEINSVLVLPGAFSMWRKDLIIEIGGFSTKTTHEDIELTVKAHKFLRKEGKPYKIVFLSDPIVWTEVPDTWKGIFLQRRRWQRVVNEIIWRYRSMLFNPRYGMFGMVGMANLLLFESLGPIVELASYIIVIVLIALSAISVDLVILFLIFSFGLAAVVKIAGILIEQYSFRTFPLKQLPRLFLLAIIGTFTYHIFMLIPRLLAMFDFLLGRKTWERVERKGFPR